MELELYVALFGGLISLVLVAALFLYAMETPQRRAAKRQEMDRQERQRAQQDQQRAQAASEDAEEKQRRNESARVQAEAQRIHDTVELEIAMVAKYRQLTEGWEDQGYVVDQFQELLRRVRHAEHGDQVREDGQRFLRKLEQEQQDDVYSEQSAAN